VRKVGLIQALEYYKQKDGNVGNAPFDFLDTEEQEVLFDPNPSLPCQF